MSSTEQGTLQEMGGNNNGEVSAEDAESLAAQFRPAWELDEAPFAAGAPVAGSDVDALAQPGGANVAPAAAAELAPPPPAPTFAAGSTILGAGPSPAALEAAIAAAPAASPAGPGMNGGSKTMLGMAAPIMPPPAPAVAQPAQITAPVLAVAQPAQPAPPVAVISEPDRPLIRSERPPAMGVGVSASRAARPAVVRPIVEAQNAGASDEYAVPRKSNLPMIAGISAVLVALAGVGIAAKFAFGSDPPAPTSQTASQTGTGTVRPKNDIPPPAEPTSTGPLSQDIPVMKPGSLPKADPGAQPADPAAAQPAQAPVAQTQPAAQAVAPPAPKPQPIAAVPVAPPPRATPPQPPQPPKATGGAAKPKGGSGSGGIVRDSPF
jgi:hypothetical protein